MSILTQYPSLFSGKAIEFSAEEKARLATLLSILAEHLYSEGHGDLSEKEVEALLSATDHFQHRLLGRRNAEDLPFLC